AWVGMSRSPSTGLYLGMGWRVLLGYFELARALSHRLVWPALLGGLLYSAGAVLNHLHWPRLWAGVFSAHELSHLFVMAGSTSHFWLMLKAVVPFEAPAPLDLAGGPPGRDPVPPPRRGETAPRAHAAFQLPRGTALS